MARGPAARDFESTAVNRLQCYQSRGSRYRSREHCGGTGVSNRQSFSIKDRIESTIRFNFHTNESFHIKDRINNSIRSLQKRIDLLKDWVLEIDSKDRLIA